MLGSPICPRSRPPAPFPHQLDETPVALVTAVDVAPDSERDGPKAKPPIDAPAHPPRWPCTRLFDGARPTGRLWRPGARRALKAATAHEHRPPVTREPLRHEPLPPEVAPRATGGRQLSDGARPAFDGSPRLSHASPHPSVCGRDVELPLRVRGIRRDPAATEVCPVLVDPLQRHVEAASKLLGRGPFLAGPEFQRVAEVAAGAPHVSAALRGQLLLRRAARTRRDSSSTRAGPPPPSDRAVSDGCDLELEPSQAIVWGECRRVPGERCGGTALHTGVLLSLTVMALDAASTCRATFSSSTATDRRARSRTQAQARPGDSLPPR